MTSTVTLRQLEYKDIIPVLKLQVDEGQSNFVAPNDYTLAEAFLALSTGEFTPRIYGIFLDNDNVGMIAIAYYGPGNDGEVMAEMVL